MTEPHSTEHVPELETEVEVQQPDLEELAQLRKGNDALEAALKSDPELIETIEEVLVAKLTGGVRSATLQGILQALGMMLDDESLQYLLMVLVRSGDPDYIQQVRDLASKPTWHDLRRLMALFGPDLAEAWEIAGEPANTWRGVERSALYDAIADTWTMSFEIRTYGGDRIRLLEAPESAVRLINGLVQTLNSVPEEAASTLVPENLIAVFLDDCQTLVSRYAPGLIEQSTKEKTDTEELTLTD